MELMVILSIWGVRKIILYCNTLKFSWQLEHFREFVTWWILNLIVLKIRVIWIDRDLQIMLQFSFQEKNVWLFAVHNWKLMIGVLSRNLLGFDYVAHQIFFYDNEFVTATFPLNDSLSLVTQITSAMCFFLNMWSVTDTSNMSIEISTCVEDPFNCCMFNGTIKKLIS